MYKYGNNIILDAAENRQPQCARYAACLANILHETAHLVMKNTLSMLTSHSVMAFVSHQAFTMSSIRQNRMEKNVGATNIHVGDNMANNMTEGGPHLCIERVETDQKIREDLYTEPLKDGEICLLTAVASNIHKMA